jgi:hypothetical protein
MPVPDFSPGEVLTASAMDSIGLWLVKTVTVGNGVSSVPVTGAFSADYDNYRIVYSGGTASATNALALQLSGSATAYNGNLAYLGYTGTPGNVPQSNNSSWQYTGSTLANGNAMALDLIGPFLTKPTWCIAAGYADSANCGTFNGFHNVSTSYSAFNILTIGGSISGGTIRVYGYRN